MSETRVLIAQYLNTAGIRVVILIARFFLVMVLGKSFTLDDFGVYGLINSTFWIGASIAGLSLSTFLVPYTAGLEESDRIRALKTTLTSEIIMALILLGAFAMSGLADMVMDAQNIKGVHRTAYLFGLVILALVLVVQELVAFFMAAVQVPRANKLLLITEALWVIPLLAAWLAGFRVTLLSLLTAMVASQVVAICYGFLFVNRVEFRRQRFDWPTLSRAIVFSIPSIVSNLSYGILRIFDRNILSLSYGPAVVGIYTFAFTLINMVHNLSFSAITQVMFPHISKAHNCNDLARRNKLLTLMLKWTLLTYTLIALPLIILREHLITWLAKPEYMSSSPLVPWIALQTVLFSIAAPARVMLVMERKLLPLSLAEIGGAVTSIILGFALVPQYSYYGAIAGNAAGLLVLTLIQYGASRAWRIINWREIFTLRSDLELIKRIVRGVPN